MPRVLDAQRFARGSPRGSNGFGCFLLDATRLAAGVPARPLRARGSPGSPRYAERRPASRRQWRAESFFKWNPAGWEHGSRSSTRSASRAAAAVVARSVGFVLLSAGGGPPGSGRRSAPASGSKRDLGAELQRPERGSARGTVVSGGREPHQRHFGADSRQQLRAAPTEALTWWE
eukprot:g8126.t1